LSTPITLAFAGSGDVDIDNVKALLNDFVGLGDEDADGWPEPTDREVTLIFPLTKEHLSDGIETVLEWVEYADLPFVAVTDKVKNRAVDKILRDAEDTEVVDNVTAKVVELLQKAEGEKHLILLWGDGSEEAELLLDAAEQAGIKAKDLSAGLDDISFESPDEEPEPEPEPEPEEEKPARGRRRGRKAEPELAEPEEEPLTEEDCSPKPAAEPEKPARRSRRKAEPEAAEEPQSLEEEVSRAAHKVQQNTAPVSDTEVDLLLVRTALESAYKVFRLEDERNAVINQATEPYRPLTELLQKALHTLGEDPKQAAGYKALATQEKAEQEAEVEEDQASPRRRRGRPRDESKTYAYLEDAEGNLTRRGRGRIPAGSKVVELTRAEIEEQGLELPAE
jgi:hypothetical protein